MFMQLIKQTKKSLVLNTKHKQMRQRGLDTGQYCSSGLQGTAFMGQLTDYQFFCCSEPTQIYGIPDVNLGSVHFKETPTSIGFKEHLRKCL